MTWPMHDARSTHAEPGPGRPGTGQPGTGQPPRPQPTFTPTGPPGAPCPPGPPGPPGGPGGPGGPRRPADPATAARHAGTPRPAATQRSSLIRSSAGMAVGTLVSRATGFLRTLVLVFAVGIGPLGNAYNNANTLPNTVYYLMLGGIFTSVVVPLLVRAARRDPDRGEAYTQRMFTLGAVALLGVTVVAMLLADPLVTLYAPPIHGPAGSHPAAQHNMRVVAA